MQSIEYRGNGKQIGIPLHMAYPYRIPMGLRFEFLQPMETLHTKQGCTLATNVAYIHTANSVSGICTRLCTCEGTS